MQSPHSLALRSLQHASHAVQPPVVCGSAHTSDEEVETVSDDSAARAAQT